MSEEEVKVEEATSFAEHLQPEAESKPEAEAPAETPEPVTTEQPAPEAKPVETPAEAPAVEAPMPAAAQTPGLGFVPVAAVQAERAKRQEIERAFEEFKSQNSYAPVESAPPAQPDLTATIQDLRVTMSEEMLRHFHPDYDEKNGAFISEVYDAQSGQLKNQALYESVMNSPFPAKAAYQAGIQILEAKKLGGWDVVSDPVKYRQAVEKQIRADVEKDVRTKLEAEFSGKAKAKSKTITDIGHARTASGATESEFVYPSFAEQLAQRSKRGR